MSSSSCIVIALATLLVCARTLAQAPPADTVQPAPAPEPASAPPPPESADAAAARTAVARAKALFAVGDYGAALADFTRAHELLRGDPRQADVLNNIAVCYERMFRYDLALTYYERYLRESTTATPEDRAEVEALMASLRDLLGTVRITGSSGAEVWIDNRQLGTVPLDVLVPAGLRVVEVRAAGHESLRRELRVTARGVHALDAQLERIDTYRGLPPTYFWIGTGLTAAALVTGTAIGIAALNEDAEGQRDVDRDLHVDGEPARDLAIQADIAFGAALALAAGTTALYFMTDWSSDRAEERGPREPRIAVGIVPDAAWISITSDVP